MTWMHHIYFVKLKPDIEVVLPQTADKRWCVEMYWYCMRAPAIFGGYIAAEPVLGPSIGGNDSYDFSPEYGTVTICWSNETERKVQLSVGNYTAQPLLKGMDQEWISVASITHFIDQSIPLCFTITTMTVMSGYAGVNGMGLCAGHHALSTTLHS
jgi:hypothetical protein